jgi:hypothetical protein
MYVPDAFDAFLTKFVGLIVFETIKLNDFIAYDLYRCAIHLPMTTFTNIATKKVYQSELLMMMGRAGYSEDNYFVTWSSSSRPVPVVPVSF